MDREEHLIRINSRLRESYNFANRSKTNDISRRDNRTIERGLTRLLKKQIEKQGHVDTGKMLRSIRITVKPDNRGKMLVDVFGVDYWKFVNGDFKILRNVQSTRAWKKIEGDYNFLNRGIR